MHVGESEGSWQGSPFPVSVSVGTMTHRTPVAPRGASALAAFALAALAAGQTPITTTAAIEEACRPLDLVENLDAWLPADEVLNFKIEVTLGPVRSLDVGSVRLRSILEPPVVAAAVPASTGSTRAGS